MNSLFGSASSKNDTGGNLNKNKVWDKAKKGQDVQTSLMGPTYSYVDNVPTTSQLGVGDEGSFNQMGKNLGAIGTYVRVLISGNPPLGNRYFVNSGGTCTAPDGSEQPRHNYINNKPTSTSMGGLIPGVIYDLGGLNPKYLFNALSSPSAPGCKCFKCDVTSGSDTHFLTNDLTPDFDGTLCKEVATSLCIKSKESFENEEKHMLATTIVAAVAAVILMFARR
jgi:hypothetical protein